MDGSIIKYLFKDFREGIEYLFRVFVINEEGIGFLLEIKEFVKL